MKINGTEEVTVFNVTLTKDEMEGLYYLLYSGVGHGTVDNLGLRGVLNELDNNAGIEGKPANLIGRYFESTAQLG